MNKLAWQISNTLMVPCFMLAGYYTGQPHVNWWAVSALVVFGGLLDIAVIAFVTLNTWDAVRT